MENLLVFLLVGLIAGWLAGFLVSGWGYGLIGSIVIGIIGAFVGGYLLEALNVVIATGSTFLNAVVTATIGAVVVIVVARLIR